MSKPFPYWLRLSIVSSLSVLLSFNPAFGGRLLFRHLAAKHACRVPACVAQPNECCSMAMPTATDCGCSVSDAVTSSANCGSCGGSIATMEARPMMPASDCGCGSSSSSSGAMESSPMEWTSGATIHSGNMTSPATSTPPFPSGTSESPPVPSIAPQVSPPEVKPALKEPTGSPSPFDATVAPKEPEPAKKPPADDLFAPSPGFDSPTVKPVDPEMKPAAPADDLFGAPPAASEPAMKPVAPADDLFGAPPAASEPAMKPTAPPADDLFGTPSPANEPAMKPAPAGDDLFGTPSTKPDANSTDDLFGTPRDATPRDATPRAAPAGDGIDDLFKSSSSPASGLQNETKKAVSTGNGSEINFDDLFANPIEMPKNEKPAPEIRQNTNSGQPATSGVEAGLERSSDALDDLFKTSQAPANKPFHGADYREWIDNTGDYSVHARLAVIFPDRIRLIKENGKFTTVPMSRLCEADRDYVTWVAVSLSNGPAAKFVNTEIDPGVKNQDVAR